MSEDARLSLSPSSKFGIDLGSGIIAGFAAAILSQPADTLLSQINKGHGPSGSTAYRLKVLAQQAGFKGLFAGLGPRMIMTAGLVSGQFLLYDGVKHGESYLLLSYRVSRRHSSLTRVDSQLWELRPPWRFIRSSQSFEDSRELSQTADTIRYTHSPGILDPVFVANF